MQSVWGNRNNLLFCLVFEIFPNSTCLFVFLLRQRVVERASLQEAQTGRVEETSAAAGRLLRRKHRPMRKNFLMKEEMLDLSGFGGGSPLLASQDSIDRSEFYDRLTNYCFSWKVNHYLYHQYMIISMVMIIWESKSVVGWLEQSRATQERKKLMCRRAAACRES